jgi:LysM domain
VAELLVVVCLAVVACDVTVPGGSAGATGATGGPASGAETIAPESASPTAATIEPTLPAPPPTLVPPTPTPLPSFFLYTVRPADTLLSIARRFATSALSVAYWNRDRYPTLDPDSTAYAPSAIQAGWHLKLIPGTTTDGEDGDPNASPEVSPQSAPSELAAPSTSPSPG